MKRAAIYARVSTSEQEKHGSSLETQIADCRTYAASQGYTVALERTDVFSGRTMSRTGLEEVLDAARRGDVDVVVCATIDRSNRNLADLLMLDRELTQLGASLEFVRDPRERTPSGDLLFQIRGAFAEYERAAIIERMRKGKMHYITAGRVVNGSHIAYGYRYDHERANLRIEETEAAIVREIFQWIGQGGHSMLSIANRLTARGVPLPQQGKVWRESTISDILHNEVYAGRWTYNKRRMVKRPRKPRAEGAPIDPDDMVHAKVDRPRSEWLFVPVPPIVSEELWQAANAQVRRNKALSPRNRKHEYLLAGLIRCGGCGGNMYGWKHGNGDTFYYKCSNYHNGIKYATQPAGACDVKAVRIEAVEAAVWDETVRQLSDRALLSVVIRDMQKSDPGEAPTNRLRLQNVAKRREGIEREAARLLDIYLTGDVPRPTYVERMAAIKRRLQSLDMEEMEIEREAADYKARKQNAASLKERVEAVREDLVKYHTFEEKRALLVGMNVEVIVHRQERMKDGHTIDIHGLLQPAYGLVVPRPTMRWRNQWTG